MSLISLCPTTELMLSEETQPRGGFLIGGMCVGSWELGLSPKRVGCGIKKNQRIGGNVAAVTREEGKMLLGLQNGERESKAQFVLCLRNLVEINASRPFYPEIAGSLKSLRGKDHDPLGWTCLSLG